MDKTSDRYKLLQKNPKFVRREARLWYKAIQKHNIAVLSKLTAPSYEDYIKSKSMKESEKE